MAVLHRYTVVCSAVIAFLFSSTCYSSWFTDKYECEVSSPMIPQGGFMGTQDMKRTASYNVAALTQESAERISVKEFIGSNDTRIGEVVVDDISVYCMRVD